MCNHHHGQFQKVFRASKRNRTHLTPIYHRPTSAYATTNLLSVYADLPILAISYK